MKIKSYLLLIIFIPVCMAVTFSLIMSNENKKRDLLFARTADLLLLEKATIRIADGFKLYSESAELVAVKGEKQLLNLVKLNGKVIIEKATDLHTIDLNNEYASDITQFINRLSRFSALITEQPITIQNTAAPLTLLDESEYQQRRDDLLSQLQTLISAIQLSIEQSRVAAESKDKHYWELSIIFPSTFIVTTFMLLLWTYRSLSLPIQRLNTQALHFENKQLTPIAHGPKEVITLSASFCELANRLFYQANHDSLTKLYNRLAFNRILTDIVKQETNSDSAHALCFIDLDHFKVINDTCGHAAGDALLQEIASMMERNVRKQDIVARLGGDEFTILFRDCSVERARVLTEKVRYAIENYVFRWGDENFHVSSSFGISEFIPKSNDLASALNLADLACMHAKKTGRNSIVDSAYSLNLPNHSQSDGLSLNAIRDALKNDSFVLFKQHIVPAVTPASPCGDHIEILLRLQDKNPDLPELSPASFMPVVERFGLFIEIDRWVIKKTVDWLLAEPNRLNNIHLCSINLSGNSICNADMLQFMEGELNRLNGQGHKLCFEITETEAINDFEYATLLINKLKSFGCYVALDDFGSGLSSFSYLKNLNIDFVKIDGCFVKDMLSDQSDKATVQAIIDVARAFDKQTIAEFVENQSLATVLKQMGVHYLQGYHFSKPEPVDTP